MNFESQSDAALLYLNADVIVRKTHRRLPTPDDQNLGSFEAMYIRYYANNFAERGGLSADVVIV